MSDDLLKRLHSLHKQATVERSHFYVGWCAKDAIHRIEELEAKLAKCEAALREYLMPTTEPDDDGISLLRTALDEITRGKDE